MKSVKLQITGLVFIAACVMMPAQSIAQWSIGATYEIRDDTPKNGVGARIERSILNPIPIIDIGLRAHFSYFNEENDISTEGENITRDVTSYDYGLAARGGVSLGVLKPYVGLGIGSNTFEIKDVDSDSQFYWNSFIGVELSPVPMLNPFVEYRFQKTDQPEFADDFSPDGRFILGLLLSF